MPLFTLALFFLAGCSSVRQAPGTSWRSERHREHPLVGRVWDVASERFVARSALDAAVAGAELVLLGEVHDNPDHHRLQAELLAAAARARRPALALEMIDVPLQGKVDAAGSVPEAVAEAVAWERSGWPDFALYRPIFEVAHARGLRIVAANLSRPEARAVVREGLGAVSAEVREAVAPRWPPGDAALAELREEMKAAHCGHLPEGMLEPMALAQAARDAQLALRLAEAAQEEGAVLIAGNGHVRRDVAVPSFLAKLAPSRSLLSVALLEVAPELQTPAQVSAAWGGALPFDYVVFTPAKERPDPCDFVPAKSGS